MLSELFLSHEFTRSEFNEYYDSLFHYGLSGKYVCIALKFKFGTQKKYWSRKELRKELMIDARTVYRYTSKFIKLGIMEKKWSHKDKHYKYFMV